MTLKELYDGGPQAVKDTISAFSLLPLKERLELARNLVKLTEQEILETINQLQDALTPVVIDSHKLTSREIEVARSLAEGKANKVIGRELGITEGGVKVHVRHLFQKAGVQNHTQFTLWAREKGILECV